MKTRILIALCAVLPMTEAAFSSDGKDPYTRFDDLSGTTVSVEVTRDGNGMYVYSYDFSSPSTNTGEILTFSVDIGCAESVDSMGFNPRDYPSDSNVSKSKDGKHVPVAIDSPRGQAMFFGVTWDNQVQWFSPTEPGEETHGSKLISPYPPRARDYELMPTQSYRQFEWDYAGIHGDEPDLPKPEDWAVHGITKGPACPGEEFPPEDNEPPSARFEGSEFAGQDDELNRLLTYSTPLRDKLRVEEGTEEIEFTIHYDEEIDRKTFRVTPERNKLRRLFNPKPGTSETVRIPLNEQGRNRISLQVQSAHEPPGQQDEPADEVAREKDNGVRLDRDVFDVWLASGERGGSEHGKKKEKEKKKD